MTPYDLDENNDPIQVELNNTEVNQMPNMKDFATSYEPSKTKNIADLDVVSVDIEIKDDQFKAHDENGEEKTVKQKIIEVDGEKYRVPISVVAQLKVQLEANPEMKKFKVSKTGTGMNTQYTVVPIL